MFDIYSTAKLEHRYDLQWLKEPAQQFGPKISRWFLTLDKFEINGGASKDMRKKLISEFLAALYVYALLLKLQKTELREGMIPRTDVTMMELTFAITQADDRISQFEQLHETQFKKKPELGPAYRNLQNVASELIRQARAATLKCSIIRRKVKLVEYWLHQLDCGDGDPIPGLDLQIQFLGSCIPEQVQLILEIMTKDAAKLMRLPDPTAKYKIETGSGLETSSSVEWTKEDFQTTVKAEAGVSYGVRCSGEGTWEITGLKASVKAELFAGARANTSFEGSAGDDGISAKGDIDVMVGVKMTFKADVEVLGIFTAELGGEAFAGALAQANFEFTLTQTDGLAIKVGAEVFAGARISGTAAFAFKLQGLPILSGSATGTLSAGIGAAFKFEFEVSPMGSTSFTVGAEVTVGLGAGGETEVKFEPGNLALAANVCYTKMYLRLLSTELETYAYEEYFKDLEVNEVRLKKALTYLKTCETVADGQYNASANSNQRLAMIKSIADAQWSCRNLQIRPKVSALDTSLVKTGLWHSAPTRSRSNAVTSR